VDYDEPLFPGIRRPRGSAGSTTVPFGGRAHERSERSRDPTSPATDADSPPPGLDTASPRGSAGSTTEDTGPLADWVLVTPDEAAP
jgi:hypothetical protein